MRQPVVIKDISNKVTIARAVYLVEHQGLTLTFESSTLCPTNLNVYLYYRLYNDQDPEAWWTSRYTNICSLFVDNNKAYALVEPAIQSFINRVDTDPALAIALKGRIHELGWLMAKDEQC